jgi:hypothetical protein
MPNSSASVPRGGRDAREQLRLDLIEELDDALVLFDRVDHTLLNSGESVADRAQDESRS